MATFRASNFLAAGTRTNSTLTKPTGTASGDLLVMFFNIETDILPVPPTGWRAGFNVDHTGAAVDQWIFWKWAGAAEPANYTITHASTWTNGYIVAIQNVSPSVNPEFSAPAQGTGTTATANGVTTTGANAWVGFFVNTFGDQGAVTPPTGSTPTFTERYESTNNVYAADGTLASAGATGTKSVTFGASQQWMATLMVVEDTATTSTNPFVVQPAYSVLTASASPSVTFNVPVAENDVVVMWAASATVAVLNAAPAGWVNALGGTTIVASDSHSMACVYHKVTAGEASAQTLTYTATSLFTAAQTGYVHAALVRNVDPTTPLDAAASTFNSGNTITPHVLAGLAGADVGTGSLVLSSVTKDAVGAYSTLPSGWEFLATTNTNLGMATLRREATTTSGVAVAATNITPSAGDEYASITVALTPGPSGPTTYDLAASGTSTSTGSLAARLTLVASASGTSTSTGSLAVAISSGAVSHALSASGTSTSTGSLAVQLRLPASASGTSTTSGSLAVVSTLAASASGTASSTGSLTVAALLPVGASGTSATSGSLTVARTTTASATGTSTTTGSLAVSLSSGPQSHALSATGTSTTSGSAAVVARLALGATGTATSTGSLSVTLSTGPQSHALTASGSAVSSGSLAITATLAITASATAVTSGTAALAALLVLQAAGTSTTSGSLAVDPPAVLTIELPDGRTLVVPLTSRTYAVPAEPRAVVVAAEDRTSAVAAESRTVIVPAADRTLELA
jgi:hypothetical protein